MSTVYLQCVDCVFTVYPLCVHRVSNACLLCVHCVSPVCPLSVHCVSHMSPLCRMALMQKIEGFTQHSDAEVGGGGTLTLATLF